MDEDVRAAVRADLDDALGRMEGLLADQAARIASDGEAQVERLARRMAEMVIRELAARALSGGDGERVGGSTNDLAAMVAQAAVRGSRFR